MSETDVDVRLDAIDLRIEKVNLDIKDALRVIEECKRRITILEATS